jgi:hypothetical protein
MHKQPVRRAAIHFLCLSAFFLSVHAVPLQAADHSAGKTRTFYIDSDEVE